MDDYVKEQISKWGELARSILRGELVNFRRDDRTLRFSQEVIDRVANLGAERVRTIDTLSATLGAGEILIDLTSEKTLPLSAIVIPQRLIVSFERIRIEARVPGGVQVESENTLASALVGFFDGMLGVGEQLISSLKGAYLRGEEFSYQFPTDQFELVRQLRDSGQLPDAERELPLGVNDGWLEIGLAPLFENAAVDVGALLKGFSLRRFVELRRGESEPGSESEHDSARESESEPESEPEPGSESEPES